MATILVQHLMNYINSYPITPKVYIASQDGTTTKAAPGVAGAQSGATAFFFPFSKSSLMQKRFKQINGNGKERGGFALAAASCTV